MQASVRTGIDVERAWMDRQVAQAGVLFNRVLVAWAGDVLELRRRGLLVPTWKDVPGPEDRQEPLPFEPMNDAA